jgi:hypothetical protein
MSFRQSGSPHGRDRRAEHTPGETSETRFLFFGR